MSIQSKLEKANIKSLYKLFDNQVTLMGKPSYVSRIRVERNKYGDDETYEFIAENDIEIIISYPSEIPLNRFRTNANDTSIDTSSIYLFDILPIEGFAKFSSNIMKGDFILDIIEDENFGEMKILMRVSEEVGSTGSVGLVYRKLLLAPYNGEIYPELQSYIDSL